jgi:sterol desaturase/sphingolipid hydroxylase (fatty acid hydroxylase superfamily)
MAADRRALQEWQSRVLDLTTSFAVGALICYRPSLLNPWDITLVQWLVGGVLLRGAIAFYDHLVETLLEISGASLLPTRLTAKPVRYVELDQNSILFLSINSVHEWIFVQRLCHYIWYSPDVSKDLSDIGLLNTLGALYVMFVVLDVCYSPCHHVFHQPWCYPLIHKHHHRQHYPTRGYLDAGNEHPIEHVVGVYSTWAAVLVAVHWTGAHAATIFFFFNLHAAMAMLNHSPYDVSCNILGIKYSVANHEMHHRKFTVNYAQYCMWYDYAMQTFADYEGPTTTTTTDKIKA